MSKNLIVEKYAPFAKGVLFIGGDQDGVFHLDPNFQVGETVIKPFRDSYRWFESLSGGTVLVYVLESMSDEEAYQEIYCKCVGEVVDKGVPSL